MPAQFGHALVHGPDLAAADDGGLPGGVLDLDLDLDLELELELEQDGQQARVGPYADSTPITRSCSNG